MDKIKTEQIGPWWFAVRRANRSLSFLAWCAKTSDPSELGKGPLDVPSSVACRFNLGLTEDVALQGLKQEVLNGPIN